jgi:hypothetical protein
VFFFSFAFRSSIDKVSKMLLFQARIMICSWKNNIFSNKEPFWFRKKNIFSTITITITGPEFVLFSCFCFKSVMLYSLIDCSIVVENDKKLSLILLLSRCSFDSSLKNQIYICLQPDAFNKTKPCFRLFLLGG